MIRVLVMGAGGHAQVAADVLLRARNNGSELELIGFLDDDIRLVGTRVMDLPVLGRIEDLDKFDHDAVFVGIGSNRVRESLFRGLLDKREHLVNLIHPNAVVSASARMGNGVLVCAGAIVNTGATLGDNIIVNTGACIDHHCTVGSHSHVAPGVHIGGDVTIGGGTLVGIGASVLPGIGIGSRVTVGSGAVVTQNVPDNATTVGVPARIIKPLHPTIDQPWAFPKKVVIYGAGGQSRVIAWAMESSDADHRLYEVVGFIDDDTTLHGTRVGDVPVVGLEDAGTRFPQSTVVCGIGSPEGRERAAGRAAEAGLHFGTFVHSSCIIGRRTDIGMGAVVLPGCVITTDTRIGPHVQIGLDCTIGHDVVIGDYSTLTPGVHVAGHVQLGRRVFVGIGAVIVNGSPDKPILIGDDAVIGAGAVVTQDIPDNVTAVGVPARIIKRHPAQ